ncbi:MAG: substrate-binding domain-containing protein [Anaerolineae bacterium]|nr:substrate-binding domain-containing protein [Anaerolineae bacterium]
MNRLGVITNNQQEVFQRGVIAGIQQVASEHGYSVTIDSYAEDPAHPKPITLNPSDVDGVLAIANAAPDDLLRTLYRMGKPVSLVSHQSPDLPIPVVLSNNTQGIAELVRHLVTRCTRRDLVFIRGLMDQRDGRQREAAFQQELLRYNLRVPEHRFLRGDFSPAVAADSLRRLIAAGDRFDGIVVSDYVMAIAAVDVLRTAGINVPGDVSVVGFGDDTEAEMAGLTTVAANITELGGCAARQLISQIKGLRISGVTLINVRLIPRQTCGCRI